ncbi:RNA 3'-terminal phosphate cyclase (ATP)/RNA 3'-terminal phosphate cyclase (GTP) [Methanohalophilus levihalophilus]|uniref:RNA 3'-terminal phosphate cyclase n=1 Tax=Methanohalophilus levihalophilus TaxID=1431282 RepID=UPI001AE48896|nr:RNA 3'-terminal phosphate cyclase [Methanohalophilus levihalophilus]MBP2029114.1 RNA 3'-terminal phosphate cyclase (ATP)/RNA 3'-terminal phosphate cyclase (GTP) [Methanohalophilus levihalophilus]
MTTIDGSHGEGGGQIVRTAVALSAVTGTPLKLENIRLRRETPGLKAQHVSGILAVAKICNAEVKGAVIGSKELEFIPGSIVSNDIQIEIPTAGSIGLVLQALMIPLTGIQKKVDITIKGGGTYGKWSPPLVYIRDILCHMLSKMGYEIAIRTEREGYYPKGGARVYVSVEPLSGGALRALDLSERGKLLRIDGISHSSSDLEKAEVSSREAETAREHLTSKYNVPINIEAAYSQCYSTGSGILLRAIFENTIIGADILGKRGVPAEVVGRNCSKKLASDIDSGVSVDEFLSDQLLPYMALAEGTSRFVTKSLSSHARTNMDIISKFINVDYSIEEKDGLTMVSITPIK